MNYCLWPLRPTNKITKKFSHFFNDVRCQYFFRDKKEDQDFNPRLYLKTNWQFQPATKDIEQAMADFKQDFCLVQQHFQKRCPPNLIPRGF